MRGAISTKMIQVANLLKELEDSSGQSLEGKGEAELEATLEALSYALASNRDKLAPLNEIDTRIANGIKLVMAHYNKSYKGAGYQIYPVAPTVVETISKTEFYRLIDSLQSEGQTELAQRLLGCVVKSQRMGSTTIKEIKGGGNANNGKK